MTTSSLRALLHRIGLDPKEIEVYLAILTLKTARASAVAKLAGQSRSHTYLMLRALEEKGLVSEIERGKVLHFVAESPEHLLSYLSNREEEFRGLKSLTEGALPQLKSLSRPLIDIPRVTLLHGLEGMKQIYREIFGNEFCAFFNSDAMYKAFGKNIVTIVVPGNRKLQGRDLIVDNKGAKRYLRESAQDEEYEIRLLPNGVTFPTDTLVYGETVVIFAYDIDLTIIRIENRNVAESFRAWHTALWEMSRKTMATKH